MQGPRSGQGEIPKARKRENCLEKISLRMTFDEGTHQAEANYSSRKLKSILTLPSLMSLLTPTTPPCPIELEASVWGPADAV